ncbi:hypothetical protein HPA15_07155 [Streptococcus suis]|nr:hypothetical protein [Streptococcus suis]
MKKTFVTLATVAALVAAAAPAVAVIANEGSAWVPTEGVIGNNTGSTTTDPKAIAEAEKAKWEAEEAAAAVKAAEEAAKKAEEEAFNKANAAGEAGVWVEGNTTPSSTQGHYDVYLQGKQQNIPGEQGYSPAEEKKAEETVATETSASTATASTTTASANTGKTAAKAVAAAKTTTGAKTLPKTSAAK